MIPISLLGKFDRLGLTFISSVEVRNMIADSSKPNKLRKCKTGLSPQVIVYYCSFQGDTYVVFSFVICFGVEFMCCST